MMAEIKRNLSLGLGLPPATIQLGAFSVMASSVSNGLYPFIAILASPRTLTQYKTITLSNRLAYIYLSINAISVL